MRASCRLFGHMDSLRRLLIAVYSYLSYFGIIIFLLLIFHLLLYLCDFINDPGICGQPRVVLITAITEGIGATAAAFIPWTIHWTLNDTCNCLSLLRLVKLL